MGMNARKWLEGFIGRLEEAADYTTQEIETDLANYESSLDSNRDAFMDIQTQTSAIMAVMQAPQIDRKEIIDLVGEIEKIIDNQL